VCGSARFTLPTMPVEDYPTLPEMPASAGTVDAAAFAAAATEAAYAPPERSEAAALRVRRELRSLLHAIGSSVPASRRLRGALSLRAL